MSGKDINQLSAFDGEVADDTKLLVAGEDAVLKRWTWASLKAAAKTYFDSLYAATSHTHPASAISDSTATGRAVLTAADAAAARSAIGAGTSSFDGNYSSLSGAPTLGTAASKDVGTAAGTVAAGDHTHSAYAATGAVGSSGLTMATARLLGRSTASTGAVEEITLGTNLSFSGTTLNAAGGGGTPGGSDTQVQFNDGGAFGGDSGLTFNKTTKALGVGGATVTTDNPVVNLTQTWNASSVTFTGLKLNITDTASAAASVPVSVQIGGAQKFAVTKGGIRTNTGGSGVKLESISGSYPGMWDGNATPGLGQGIFFENSGYALYLRATSHVNLGIGGNHVRITNSALKVTPTLFVGWATSDIDGALDVALRRNAAGVVEVNDGVTAGTFRDLKLRNLIGTGNLATGTAAKSADYTATTSDGTIEVDASGAARTITLFAASGNAGKIIAVKKTDSSANAVTVDANASETIDGATTISLTSQYSTVILQVNAAGTGWNKLGGV